MEPKKKAFEFTSSMILFYFLSTSILIWINGMDYDDLGFYLIVLALCLLCFYWIVRVIKAPHYVKNKESKAPTVLFVIGVVFAVLLLPSMESLEDFFEALYLFWFFVSMAGLIKWYKETGVSQSQNNTDEVETPAIDPGQELTEMEQLRASIKEALNITPTGTEAYNHLIRSDRLVEELILENIQGPNNITKQMIAVIDHYTNLVNKKIKTKKVVDTLTKLEGTLKMVEDTLIQIYDIGIDQQISDVEMDSEAFENLVEILGLKGSDFNIED